MAEGDASGSAAVSGTNEDDGSAPEVDTTLLESLFYNEMMMLEDGSDFLSSVTGGTGEANANIPPPPVFRQGPGKKPATGGSESPTPVTVTAERGHSQEDPLTFAEQTLLRDFGVTDSQFPHLGDGESPPNPTSGQLHHQQTNPPDEQAHPATQLPHATTENSYQSHDPNQYPHQPYYPSNTYYPHQTGLSYPSHPPPPPTYQNGAHQPTPIQPRPPPQPQRISKGIKHSVAPKESMSPQSITTTASPTSTNSIPNPLVNQQQPLPHHQHSHHAPPYHTYPHHQAHHPQHQGQHAYHYHPHHPQPGSSTPVLVPVPAPAPGPHHHQQSAYPPPPHPGVQPPPHYGSAAAPPPPHTSSTTSAHPPAPLHYHSSHAHSHAQPHSHPNHPPPPPPPPPPHSAPTSAPTPSHPHTPAPQGTQPQTQAHAAGQPPKEQLVSQFATLANRLGISLPKHLLSSLTKSAGMVSGLEIPNSESSTGSQSTAQNSQTPGPQVPFPKHSGDGAKSTYAPRQSNNGTKRPPADEAIPLKPQSDTSTPVVVALRRTAEEAIAAVTRKRSHDESSGLARGASTNSQSGDENKSNSNKASYAKRKKKPRLADCESRLAQLRAENETLKRHLDNITNQTEKFEQDRIKAEDMMKQMMENDETPDEELDKVIREYSEAYSDYGRRRHEELSFHLEQLQKLANPTNFTKMGLWTIARANGSKDMSKQNPLVGILQKELGISPPQIRKILEQRQKIRSLCNNLNATLGLILQLKELCEQKNKKFNDRLNKTREILTPKQVVKLIMWIKNYSDVLGNICPGWTSEQIVKKKAVLQKEAESNNSANANCSNQAAPADEKLLEAPSSSNVKPVAEAISKPSADAKTEAPSATGTKPAADLGKDKGEM